MHQPSRTLKTLTIQEPCTLRWEELQGDDRQRFCGKCSRHVHNLSALREEEAERLVAGRAEGDRLCVTYLPGPGGKPLTLSERGRLPRARRWGLRLLARGLTSGAFGFVALLAGCSPRQPEKAPTREDGSPATAPRSDDLEDLRALGGLVDAPAGVAIMGEVALEQPIVMGKVSSGD